MSFMGTPGCFQEAPSSTQEQPELPRRHTRRHSGGTRNHSGDPKSENIDFLLALQSGRCAGHDRCSTVLSQRHRALDQNH